MPSEPLGDVPSDATDVPSDPPSEVASEVAREFSVVRASVEPGV